MKVVNKTRYDVRAFKRLVRAVARRGHLDPEHEERLHITLTYGRSRHTGCASIGGSRCTIRLPLGGADPVVTAWLLAHEFAHLRGLLHRRYRSVRMAGYTGHAMSPEIMHFTDESRRRFAWASALPLPMKTERQAAPLVGSALAEKRRAAAATALARWETKAKRAATAMRKLRVKIRYYDRRLAAGKDGAP